MNDHEIETPAIERHNHRVKAKLTLSGTDIIIGSYSHAESDSLFIKLDEIYEPIYISHCEAVLLIAAIKAAMDGALEK